MSRYQRRKTKQLSYVIICLRSICLYLNTICVFSARDSPERRLALFIEPYFPPCNSPLLLSLQKLEVCVRWVISRKV